jgi:hypothetical protein
VLLVVLTLARGAQQPRAGNRGDYPVRFVSAGFDADDGTANSTWVHGQKLGATLPGVVQPRDAGLPTSPRMSWVASTLPSR